MSVFNYKTAIQITADKNNHAIDFFNELWKKHNIEKQLIDVQTCNVKLFHLLVDNKSIQNYYKKKKSICNIRSEALCVAYNKKKNPSKRIFCDEATTEEICKLLGFELLDFETFQNAIGFFINFYVENPIIEMDNESQKVLDIKECDICCRISIFPKYY